MACTLRWMVGWLIMLYVRLPAVAIAHAIRVPAVAIAMAGTHHAPLLLGVTRRVFSFLGVCVVVLSDLASSEAVGRVCLRARINLNLNLNLSLRGKLVRGSVSTPPGGHPARPDYIYFA